MKTISKKIKTIYLLAMMAILSVCIAVFPVFKTETVKAETEPEVSLTGAYLQVSIAHGADDFALMFQAKINQEWYENTAKNQDIKFGMAIGPVAAMADLSAENLNSKGDAIKVIDAIIGTVESDATQKVIFDSNKDDLTYEAGTYFDRFNYSDDAADLATWQNYYAMELTAVPFITVVDGETETTTLFAGKTTSAKQVAFDTMMVETNKPADSFQNETYAKEVQRAISDEAFKQITGYKINAQQFEGKDIYLEKHTYKMLAEFYPGYTTGTYARNQLSSWAPIPKNNWSVANAYTSGYIAGQPLKDAPLNAKRNAPVAFSTTHVDNPAAFNDLIGGANYRFYYFDEANGALDYFEYKVADGVIGGGRSNGYGSSFIPGITVDSSTSVVNSYFHYGMVGGNKPNVYMPKTYVDRGYENYDGYYVLGGDVVIDPLNVTKTTDSSGATIHNDTRSVIGAMKNSNRIHQLDTTDINDYAVAFTGTFDGRGHTIDSSFVRGGIFGVINGGTVKNLNVVADLFEYSTSSANKTQTYSAYSYGEKHAVLAELVYDANIENVSIKLEANAPKNFVDPYYSNVVGKESKMPEMDKIPALISAFGIRGENTKLTNVIVECDSLKDVDVSFQNYRAAFNISSEVKAENINNVFAIGSSYSYMTLDGIGEKIEAQKPADAYVLTMSYDVAPFGLEFGVEYQLNQNQDLIDAYGETMFNLCKFMKKVNIIEEGKIMNNVYIKFVQEKTTKKFATNADFQAWLDGDGVDVKTALLATGLWLESADGTVAWDYVAPVVGKDASVANGSNTYFEAKAGWTMGALGDDTAYAGYGWFTETYSDLIAPAE